MQKIPDEMFEYSGLETLDIPDSVTEIGDSALYGTNISSVTFPEGLEVIKRNALRRTQIREVTIPKAVRKIGSEAFYGCENLKKVKFEGTVEEMGRNAFAQIGEMEINIG